MLSSIYFFAYLFACVNLYWILPGRIAKTTLLSFSSLAFIHYHSPESCFYLLGITGVTYVIGIAISKSRYPVVFHRLGIVLLSLALFVAKYLKPVVESLDSLLAALYLGKLPTIGVVLIPLGISYIIFKYISYLTDIYWKVTEPGHILDFLCYGSLFTIFFAGPIERFERLKPQMESKASITNEMMIFAYTRIIQGLFKKYIVVNWLFMNLISKSFQGSGIVDRIVYALGYAVYIYIDFSSYSDIAIGSSALFGLKIKENFAYPYASTNITDFWKRWHISLSEWIRDYVFFPLARISGKRFWQLLGVPLLAMGFCGVWHGSGVGYLVWGLSHGAVIGWYQYSGKKLSKKSIPIVHKSRMISNLLLMGFIVVSWVFFYPRSSAITPTLNLSIVNIVLIVALFSAAMLWENVIIYLHNQRTLKYSSIVFRHPILMHTALLFLTIGFGVFNTDNTFVYVNF